MAPGPRTDGATLTASARVAPARATRRRRLARVPLAPYLFCLPFVLAFLAMVIFPMGYAAWLSLFQERMVGGTIFVGLANYAFVIADPKFWRGIQNVLWFGMVQIPVMLSLALVLALILDSSLVRARGLFRAVFYMPYAVPTVIAALIWGYLYGPSYGPFTQLADAMGWSRPAFLTERGMLWSIGNIVTWEYTGYNMIILFAALQAVPRDLEEAASLDGAGPVAFALHIKLPLIVPALMLCAIFSIIGTFQLFNEPQILQSLAPQVIRTDYTPNVYAYSLAFTSIQYNLAAAVSFVLAAILAVVSYVFIRLTSRFGASF
ncbi:carbohydrate ABC transporter permease [Histidinibacterium lentulum]|uniref:Sugar ABC transporter permease n=1 Tax=Histidinibacterium lentulum TaxID=2480588 RepID=A0A3N2QYA1_9RHOB|nr:sugar ABC transporter permease [Histidinibacterium lentulum]ROU00167.1 sugar ABC transporter permease [Histidinibacterium lentulum]